MINISNAFELEKKVEKSIEVAPVRRSDSQSTAKIGPTKRRDVGIELSPFRLENGPYSDVLATLQGITILLFFPSCQTRILIFHC